jgi:hypothetical protein
MVEWRWDLAPMTARDRNAQNLAEALDFSARTPPISLDALPEEPEQTCPAATNAPHTRP